MKSKWAYWRDEQYCQRSDCARGRRFVVYLKSWRDPTGVENISSVLRFFNEDTKVVTERLLTLATSSSCDAQALTEVICSELDAAGLATSNILSQVYDRAAVMSGKHGEVQRLLQEREGREIPYVYCLNHQLHLVVVHALSEEQAVQDFLRSVMVCTVFSQTYNCVTIQRWKIEETAWPAMVRALGDNQHSA